MNPKKGLFLRTWSLTHHQENFLTEFVAAALESDQRFRAEYLRTVIQPFASRHAWPSPEISEIRCQMPFKDFPGTPDLYLKMSDGKIVLCEHKIEAPEGTEREYNGKALKQLQRYLKLTDEGHAHAVAYFRESWKAPSRDVLCHPAYVRPPDNDHFLWSDLLPALSASRGLLPGWLREGFEFLGWTPPVPHVGDLEHPKHKIRLQKRRNFAKFWNKTKPWLRHQGWTIGQASQCSLILTDNLDSSCKRISIAPKQGGRNLVIRFTPRKPEHIPTLQDALTAAASHVGVEVESSSKIVPRSHKKVPVNVPILDVRAVMANVLRSAATTAELETRLFDYVTALLGAIPKRDT